MSRSSQAVVLLAALAAAPVASPADPVPTGWQTDARLGLGLFGEGDRDLGLGTAKSTTEGYADLQGTAYWNSGGDWAGLLRGELFQPTGELTVTDEDQPRRSKSYARLREGWLEYGGLTSYPGEVLRFGLQRLRDPDGQWFDSNVEAVRWIFDTTLLQADAGVAESLKTWRSDGSEPNANVRDRTYLFGRLGRQWREGHFFGTRVIHAFDHADPEQELVDGDRDPKRTDRNLTWIDLYAHNNFYDGNGGSHPGLSYWADVSALVGTRKDFTTTPGVAPIAVTEQKSDVTAFATDLGLRYRLPMAYPVLVGGNYAFGSGSEQGDTEHRYEQTGLHSNLSRFTGTRTQMYRYNMALQPDLTNLHVGTLYVSIPQDRWDASLVYSKFARQHAGDPVVTDGISVQPVPGRKLLGEGVDVAVAYYFSNPVGRGKASVSAPQEDDNLRSNIRLRASMFDPNIAFPKNADPQYAVRLELTLWF